MATKFLGVEIPEGTEERGSTQSNDKYRYYTAEEIAPVADFLPLAGGTMTGSIQIQRDNSITNTSNDFGIKFGLNSPVPSDTILVVGDIYDLASPPATGITNSLLIGGSQLGIQGVYFANINHSNNIESYLSLGTEGVVIRRNVSSDEYAFVQVDENDEVAIYTRSDEGSGKRIQLKSENHDGAGLSHEIEVLAELIQIKAKNGINTLRLFMQNLGTYADNASAITGGLLTDEVYKTATGELRIVV